MTVGIFLHTLAEHTAIYLRLRALHPDEVAKLEGESEPQTPPPEPPKPASAGEAAEAVDPT